VVTNGAPLDTPSVLVNKDAEDLALEGFDPVVYFRKFYFGRISLPQEGLAEITGVHNDSIYRMASPEHQQLFMLCPSRYVPAFGGYCAVKVAQGVLEVADPTIYDIVEGRVVVFSTFADFTQWQRDPELYAKAKASWPSLVLCYGTHPSNVTPLINADESGVALHGYDPVAYFTQHKAVVGGDEGSRYHDATYWFATAEHQEQFQKAPKKFSPAFGGYCAYGVSRGVLKDITPTLFDVRGGRLVLLQNKEALDAYKRDPAGVLAKADANWIKLQESGGRSQPAPTRASA
jgi:YHS domain-containing protein